MFRDIYALRKAVAQEQQVEYFHFWGHTPKDPHQVDKSCLSQWFPATFTVEGIDYPTAEHFMMASKARLFEDTEVLAEILQSSSPHEAKRLGRKVRSFDENTWKHQRMDLVVTGNYAKFSQHEDLKAFLLSTGNKILVEASPYDKIWGIGMEATHAKANNPHGWKGLNLLGFALMQVREALQNS